MGINLEFITLLNHLKNQNLLSSVESVCEFGAQNICANSILVKEHLKKCGIQSNDKIDSAKELYKIFGFNQYTSIDATAEYGSLPLDLNKNIHVNYNFTKSFDLVTDLGTFEHVFNIKSAFQNAHEICKTGGLMIHALP